MPKTSRNSLNASAFIGWLSRKKRQGPPRTARILDKRVLEVHVDNFDSPRSESFNSRPMRRAVTNEDQLAAIADAPIAEQTSQNGYGWRLTVELDDQLA